MLFGGFVCWYFASLCMLFMVEFLCLRGAIMVICFGCCVCFSGAGFVNVMVMWVYGLLVVFSVLLLCTRVFVCILVFCFVYFV